MTTLDVLLANKDRKEPVTVYERVRGTNHLNGEPIDDFTGGYTYAKGKIKPLDGDSYSVHQAIVAFDWLNQSHLTVWYEGDYLTAEEYDAELKRFIEEHKDEIEKMKNGR